MDARNCKKNISETKNVKDVSDFMIPYVLLMFVPLLFSHITFSNKLTESNGKWVLATGGKQEIINHSGLIPVFFIILLALLALKDVSIGNDTFNYQYYFEKFYMADISDVFQEKSDILYWLLVWAVGRITDNFQIFLAIAAMIMVLPIAIVYSEDGQYGFLKLVLFINMSTFVLLFSGLRQSVALAMGMIAYEFVKRKKPVRFLLFALIALGFHHSGFMVFLFYPLYHAIFKKKHLWFIVPAIVLVFVFNRVIFAWGTQILNYFSNDKYDLVTSSTGAYAMLLVFIVFAVLAYVIPDEQIMDRETLGLRNFLLMAVLLQCFAPIHTLAMRLNYYFILFIPILIPKILKYTKKNLEDVTWWIRNAMVVFFVVYYLVTTYNSCQTGVSALDTYPYVPFWQ